MDILFIKVLALFNCLCVQMHTCSDAHLGVVTRKECVFGHSV